MVSGGDSEGQLGLEMKFMGREKLHEILEKMDLSTIRIPTGALLSAQLDLRLAYSQCDGFRRSDLGAKSIRVFAAPDCSLLSLWYGLSGACGDYEKRKETRLGPGETDWGGTGSGYNK
ncbi:hypothetical protein Bbelb_133470 [Branchiostoma belcheri]|nr:hypothetical protein Bbelb_133470 [Branchiostoma belcheri]